MGALILMAALTHLFGIFAVTDAGATYRARADSACTLQIERSTASNLAGSTTSAGVAVISGDDFTGGEAITGLSANTVYYYSILVDGVRAHSAPYPSFTTFPAEGVDATVTIAFGSCQTSGTETQIFAAVAAAAPDLVLHLGDFGYADATTLATQRSSYQAQYVDDYLAQIVRQFPQDHTWSDHDYGGNNSDSTLSGKANSLQAFKEYRPHYPLANAANGVWHSGRLANVEVFVLDTRYQRKSGPRFPSSASVLTADTGSTGSTLVIPASASPSAFDNAYNGYYVKFGDGVVERVLDYVAATRTLTLSRSVPSLSAGVSTFHLRFKSLLDGLFLASNQVDWLVDGLNASTARWKVIVSAEAWNPSYISNSDAWGGYDVDQMESLYLRQHITATYVFVFSGDRHRSAIDDGTNAYWPEITASPFNQSPATLGGTWTQGIYGAGHSFGLATFTASSATLAVKDATGGSASGVTPLTITIPAAPSPTPIRWLRAA